jgi:N-glycosylase/DNA lyase
VNTIDAPDFDLRLTLDSGQVFRFRPRGDGWLVNARDRFFYVEQRGERLAFDGVEPEFLVRYFRLDDDHAATIRALEFDPLVSGAARRFRGLRIVRQDPWECLVTFICSSISNIPKIRLNVDAIAASFGRPVRLGAERSFAFPDPGGLRDEGKLRAAKVGFRAAYLLAANERVREPWLEGLRRLPLDSARTELMALPGVAEKIADCVLLFSLDFTGAFPVDVWIHRIVQRAYFRNRAVSPARVREWASRRFGALAGHAESFLYVQAREDGARAVGLTASAKRR